MEIFINWLKTHIREIVRVVLCVLVCILLLYTFGLLPKAYTIIRQIPYSSLSMRIMGCALVIIAVLYFVVYTHYKTKLYNQFKKASFYFVFTIVFIVTSICAFVANKWHSIVLSDPIDTSIWGQFGDFVGGTLGVLLSLASVLIITWTFRSQVRASYVQRFHNIFFELIHLYQTQVNDLSQTKIYMENEYIACKLTSTNKDFFESGKKEIIDSFLKQSNGNIIDSYLQFYNNHYDKVSAYFRTIYRLYDLIHNSRLEEADKKEYLKIIRAQFTSSELFFIRLNSLSFSGMQFRKYVRSYNVLKHVRFNDLVEYKKSINYIQYNGEYDEFFCRIKNKIRHAIVYGCEGVVSVGVYSIIISKSVNENLLNIESKFSSTGVNYHSIINKFLQSILQESFLFLDKNFVLQRSNVAVLNDCHTASYTVKFSDC